MKVSLAFFIIYICMTSCSSDEPSAPPNASFFFDVEQDERGNFVAEIQDTIVFDNKSTNGTEFLWGFEDGSTSNAEVPQHKYLTRGTYNVTLTAFNGTGEVSSVQKQLQVGGRSFRNLVINKISNFKPDGSPWDGNSPPDLLFYFGEVNNPQSEVVISFFPDIALDEVPFGGDVDFDVNTFLTDTEWFFVLIDNDEPMDRFDANDEHMFEITFNPTRAGFRNLQTSFGRFDLKDGVDRNGNPTSDYEMAITWDFKVEQE